MNYLERLVPIAQKRSLQLIVLGLSVLITAMATLRRSYPLLDLDVYKVGGQILVSGLPLYEKSFLIGHGIYLPFTYPPFAAILFAPLSYIPKGPADLIFTLLSVTCVWWIIYLCLKNIAPSLSFSSLGSVAFLFLPLGLMFQPVSSTLGFGQINIILVALVATDLLLPRTPWPRGTLIGLAAAIKLTPAVFGLFFLLRKDWRSAITSIIAGLGFTILAAVISWNNSLQYWTITLFEPDRIGSLSYSGNQSLRGLIARTLPESVQSPLWVVGSLLIFALIVWLMIILLREEAYVAAVITNSLLALLLSPVSWSHHWIWTLPMMIVLGFSYLYYRNKVTLVAFCFSLPLTTVAAFHTYFPQGKSRELDWSWWQHILGTEYVLIAVVWLILAFWRPQLLKF